MKVQELIELLETANPETSVVLDDGDELYRPGILIDHNLPEEPVFIFKGIIA